MQICEQHRPRSAINMKAEQDLRSPLKYKQCCMSINREDPDQTAQMCMLIWAFAVCYGKRDFIESCASYAYIHIIRAVCITII